MPSKQLRKVLLIIKFYVVHLIRIIESPLLQITRNRRKCLKNDLKNYREFSSYANFICANFITAIFQNFPKIFGLCILGLFISLMQFYTIELAKNLPNAILFAIYFSYCDHQVIICLMRFLANATFYRSQKSHQARTLCTQEE